MDGTAQVKVAVLQTDLVADDLLGVVDLERGGLRLGQNADVLGNNFDLAGRHLLVDGGRVAATSLPFTATTNSVRQVNAMSNRSALTDLSNVHCTMPARSRSSRNSTPPLSRTVNPAVYGNGLTGVLQTKSPHICVRFMPAIDVLFMFINPYY